jgi:hypothetical protein
VAVGVERVRAGGAERRRRRGRARQTRLPTASSGYSRSGARLR